jgi:cytochrome c oxidase cbb3-type subunit III
MRKRILITSGIIILINISTVIAQAPAGPTGIAKTMTDPMSFLIVFCIGILLATILVMTRVIKLLTWQISGAPQPAPVVSAVAAAPKKVTVWTKLNNWMNDAVPVEKEADVLLDHDYDGIKELDNNLPPWWKYGFYMTIVFAFVYILHYHVVGSGNVQLDEYNEQLADAELLKQERLKNSAANVDENSITVLTADAALASGKKIYTEKCVVCHGASGEGNVGPNLTDNYWIHGGDIKDVFKIVKYGFPTKGMLAWQGQLTPVQMQEVASYIKSLKGTNPANPKAPQGDLFEEVPAAVIDSAQATSTASAL